MRLLSHNDNILARYAITADGILPMMVIKPHGDGTAELTPFDRETANTVWANSAVLLLRPEEVTEFLLDDLQMMVDQKATVEDIYRYFAKSDLFAPAGEPTVILAIQ